MDILNIILNNVGFQAAIFNSQQVLQFCTSNLASLWKIPSSNLDVSQQIEVESFFYIILEGQEYPRKHDWVAFCKEIKSYFTTLTTSLDSYITLTDGRTIKEIIIPHQGGLIFLWQDVTQLRQEEQRRHIAERSNQIIVDELPVPLIIVNAKGCVEACNSQFLNFFNLDSTVLHPNIPVDELLGLIEPLHQNSQVTEYLKRYMVNKNLFTYNLTLTSGINLDISNIILADNNWIVLFRNTSTISPNLNFEAIKSNLKQLQEDLLLGISKVCSSSLINIIGFSELLKEGHTGQLNSGQQTFLSKITREATNIKENLEHHIELTLYNDTPKVTKTEVELDYLLLEVTNNIRSKLENSGVTLTYQFSPGTIISTNYKMLTKLIILTLSYLIGHNATHGEITVSFQNKPLTISFQDHSRQPIFGSAEVNQLNVILILKTLDLLGGHYKVSPRKQSGRMLTYMFGRT